MLGFKPCILVIFSVEIYFRKSRNNVSENERIGNKSAHEITLCRETNLREMIRHMFVVSKSLLRPPGCIWSTQSVCFCTSTYFAFFVLSMTRPSHRQAGRNTSICILNMSRKWLPSQLLSLCLADRLRMSVYVTQTKYSSLQIPPCSKCEGWVSQKAISLSILNWDK